ncbi:polymorphic toxin-type HINT domain-containing protein [Actinoplanes missouriensis]|uniref:polymorphic toxin-type HINT domain-containing protein n=1 Tax=Actinoplanes missouriensis TaxID=1866 RepID=UPI0036833FEF
MLDRDKLEDSLNAEYAEDEGNPTRQRTCQAFDLATALLPAKGPKGGIKNGPPPRASAATRCLHSFDPDTQVLLADGSHKAIEDVEVGDKVTATDPATGETTGRAVTTLHRNQDTDLVDLTVRAGDGEADTLRTTAHHPFWNDSTGAWTDAADLKPGDVLRTAEDSGTVVVQKVHAYTGDRVMRDLTVEGTHTYYVMAGVAPVLVHNCGVDADYGRVLPDGRRTGVTAIVKPADIGTGTTPSRRILPPGFTKNTPGMSRGHLLPKVLGGDGRNPANIVKTKSKTDNGAMAAFSDSIAAHITASQREVMFTATPRYLRGENVPFRVDIRAFGDHGWSTAAQFLVQ